MIHRSWQIPELCPPPTPTPSPAQAPACVLIPPGLSIQLCRLCFAPPARPHSTVLIVTHWASPCVPCSEPATLQTREPPLPAPPPPLGPLNFKQLGIDLQDWQERSPRQGKPGLAVIKLCHCAGCRQKGTHNGIRLVIN